MSHIRFIIISQNILKNSDTLPKAHPNDLQANINDDNIEWFRYLICLSQIRNHL